MSFVTYQPPGGQVIRIDAVNTRLLENRPLFDRRGGYLYNKVRLEVNGWLNPQLNAYQRTNTGDFTATVLPTIGQDTLGPATLAAIRDALCKPQGQLVVNLNDVEVLRSPPNGVPCDCVNGPLPIDPDTMIEAFGKTLIVRFVVETYIREKPGTKGSAVAAVGAGPTPLLSHTWDMVEDVDRDTFSVRTVRGRMVFRTDVLMVNTLNPDQFRNWAFHPIPPRFQRENIEVTAEESGAQLVYSFQDRELPFNLDSSITSRGVTHIESQTTNRATVPSSTDIAFGVIGFGGQVATTWMGSGSRRGGGWSRRDYISAGFGTSIQTVGFLRSICPIFVKVTVVRVWGRRDTPRNFLSQVAHRILINRTTFIGLNPAPITRYSMDISETHENTGEYVELTGQFVGTGLVAQNVGFGYPATGIYFNQNDEIPTILTRQNVPTVTLSDSKSRGSYLAGVVAQILQNPDATLPAPTNLAVGANATP